MSGSEKRSGLTRRGFLKATGAAAAGVSFAGLCGCAQKTDSFVLADTGSSDRVKFCTTCAGNCVGFACPVDVFVQDGLIVDIENYIGDEHPDYHSVCQRGYTNLERMYSPDRNQFPLRRAGERGSGEWERISWEEAIDEICSKWRQYQEEDGPESIMFFPGSGSFTATMGHADRLRNYLGATKVVHNYDANGVNSTSKHIGKDPMVAFGNEMQNLTKANTIFCWGCNPSESMTISHHFLTEAQELGAKVVTIDPIFTTTAGRSDEYVYIRPGTDGLLAMAMMKIIVRDGRQDDEILKTKTVAPYLVKKDGTYLRKSDFVSDIPEEEDFIMVSDGNGAFDSELVISDPVLAGSFECHGFPVTTAYSLLLDRMNDFDLNDIAEKTTIDLDMIEHLTEEFLDGPTTILTGFGIDHYANGITGYMNMLTLLDISGMECKPGTGISICDLSLPIAQGRNYAAWSTPADVAPGPSLAGAYVYEATVENSLEAFPNRMRSLFLYAHNVIGNYPERQSWLEIFENLDLVVVADPWMTESCRYADIVLPVAFMWETRNIARDQGNPYLRLMDQAAEPQFESKSDFDIVQLLAEGMGLKEQFNLSLDEFLALCLDNDVAREYGITYDRLLAEGRIDAYEEGRLYGVPKFNTATGRSQFYLENTAPEFKANRESEWDQELRNLPYWFPPHEAWHENELHQQYPLIFTSERSKFKVHTQFSYVPSLLELESEPYVKLNPDDAASRGITEGDTVRLYNDRGYVVVKAIMNDGVPSGMVLIDHGWQGDQFIEGHYSDLSSRYVDYAIPGPAWFDCLCEVEREER